MEPIFKKEPYSKLVPRVRIKLKDGDEVNLLDAGHRAADAVIRFSKSYGPKLYNAFKVYLKDRDCSQIVKLAPTSIIFGVWDSRGTGAKIQRVVRSVIRAYNVIEGKRSATYRAAYDYTENDVISPECDKGSGKDNPLSQEGFKYSLATKTHGGVFVKGDIQQEAIINLVSLRMVSQDLPTKRYLLGLSLVALSYRDQEGFNLREGCLLCAATKSDFQGQWKVVRFDSTEDDHILKDFTHEQALAFASETAGVMKIEKPDADIFDKDTAEKWLTMEKKKRKVLKKAKHPASAIAAEAAPEKETKQTESTAGQPETQARQGGRVKVKRQEEPTAGTDQTKK